MKETSLLTLIAQDLLQLFYPGLCPGCGSDTLSQEQFICIDCLHGLPFTNFHLHQRNPVERIFDGRIPVASACSLLYFTKQSPIQHILHRIKYRGDQELGRFFGRMMGRALIENEIYRHAKALIPLPLFYRRQKQRGYNQSALLCEGISETMQIPVLDNLVARKRNTETQTRKTRTQRWENLEGKFVLQDSEVLRNQYVLLVDDVLTTGATLESCGAELLKTPGLKLGLVTLAYASS